jgi:3-oxoacyl-(acyl-carrier-protein) synthase
VAFEIEIAGAGLITAIGNNLEENLTAMRKQVHGIGKAQYVNSRYTELMPFAEVKMSSSQLGAELQCNDQSVTRTQLLALKAFKEALLNSGLSIKELKGSNTAIIIASTVGGMYLTDELYNDANKTDKASSYISNYDGASIALLLQKISGVKGVVNTINTACSSGANAIMYGVRLLRHHQAERVIVGGVDCLSKFTINGFNSLNILSKQVCKPFDQSRDGLNLGEGAGFVILESSKLNHNKKSSVMVSGFANASDAFHPSALSDTGNGPELSMKQAIKRANLKFNDIDSVIAHGTGTPNNDRVEGVAMKQVFANRVPPFVSIKSVIGHTLGAASVIESIFAVEGLKNQEIYASSNFTVPDEQTQLSPNTKYHKASITHCLLNSFGFGGNCSSVVYSLAKAE